MLFLIIISYSYLNYWRLSQEDHAGINQESGMFYHDPVVKNEANAPYQYRIGLALVVEFIRTHSSLQLRHIYGAIDGITMFLSIILIIYNLFLPNKNYFEHSIQLLIIIVLWSYQLLWTLTWYPVPYTFPALFYVTCFYTFYFAWNSKSRSKWKLVSFGLITFLLSFYFCFIRPDVSLALGIGYLFTASAYIFFNHKSGISPSVFLYGIYAGIIVIVSLVLQFYLIMVFPNAINDSEVAFQLMKNFNLWRLIPFILFMLPIFFAYFLMLQKKFILSTNYSNSALLFSGIVYILIWLMYGKIDEVRIIVPFSFLIVAIFSSNLVKKYLIYAQSR